MKKTILLSLFILLANAINVHSQNLPLLSETILLSNRDNVKAELRRVGFEISSKTINVKELNNEQCYVICGTSEWCQSCFVYFKEGESTPVRANFLLVNYPNVNKAANDWLARGYESTSATLFQALGYNVFLPKELIKDMVILIRDDVNSKYSYITEFHILSTPLGVIVNSSMTKTHTSK